MTARSSSRSSKDTPRSAGWSRAITQACAIGVLAVALGAVHAAIRPVQLSLKPAEPVAPPPPPTTPKPIATPTNPTDAMPPTPPAAPDAPKVGSRVTIDDLRTMMAAEPVQFVDARNASEFASGHITGAVLLTPDMFAVGLPEAALALDRGAPVVVYCTGGDCHSSELVAIRLQGIGYTRLFIYEGGYDAWKAAGMPVQAPSTGGGGTGGGGR